MYNIEKLGEKTYYLAGPSNVGIYVENKEAYIIDTGNGSVMGPKILKRIGEMGWTVKAILNTHCHCDHTGANNYIQKETNCPIYGNKIEFSYYYDTTQAPAVMYGGAPNKEMKTRTFMAEPSKCLDIEKADLPKGLSLYDLPGHTIGMKGIMTDDGVFFIGDLLLREASINKHHITYNYDLKQQLESLEKIKNIKAKFYVPSHTRPIENIEELVEVNKKNIYKIADMVFNLCSEAITSDELTEKVMEKFNMKRDINKYLLVGSTLKGYLTYLYDDGLIVYRYRGYKLVWQKANKI